MRIVTLLLLGSWIFASCGADPRPPSGVLITLDTTNAVALDIYGKHRGITPELERFAEECVIYEQARSVAPITVVAHASMLTGLYPPRHTVRDNGHLPLPQSAETLAEAARQAGYRTGAVIAASVMAAQYGLDQGFERYDGPHKSEEVSDGGIRDRPAWEVTRRAIALLDEWGGDEPFFLWVHYFDPHAPYDPPQEHLERAGGRGYLGEVAAMDASLGRLFERLRAEPDYDEMTIVVVGDHGESHGRHGEGTHGLLAYDVTLRVPLLVRYPGAEGAGERSEELSTVADVYPTFLECMQLTSPERAGAGVDGRSLIGPDPSHAGVYFECYSGFLNYGWSPLVGWADAESKYLHCTGPELYNVVQDRQETSNLYGAQDPRVQRAKAALERLSSLEPLPREGDEEVALPGSAEIVGLGYGGSASPETEIPDLLYLTDLPSPRTRLSEFDDIQDAINAAGQDDFETAIRLLEGVNHANPRNVLAATRLSRYLVKAGEPGRALAPLEALIASDYDGPILHQRLAEAYMALGDYERGLAEVKIADEQRPNDPGTIDLRARLEKLAKTRQ